MEAEASRPKIVSSQEPPKIETIKLVPKPRHARASVVSRGTGIVDTRPCFTSSWIEDTRIDEGANVKRYAVDGVGVSLSLDPVSSSGRYVLDPPEYRMNPIHIQVLADAASEIVRTLPADIEIASLSTIRPHIKARAKDIVYSKLASRSPDDIGSKELEGVAEELAGLLCKYTAGYGILETLLSDPAVQDIYIDAPSSQTPVQVVIRSGSKTPVGQKCRTNVFVGRRDLAGLVSRIKFDTGLPFSEAHPVLEADIKHLRARVTLVGPPLSDKGVAIAIRKHSEGLWPLHLLISRGSLSPLLSSFLWACVIGRRTVLVAGSRGAGKTTLLASMMLEFPISQRVLVIEDTPEIPVRRLQELGYDIQSLRFSEGSDNHASSAENSLRVSLRMGESAIVIGEVRGEEAKVLYESMRAGSAGSSVLGTIHGNSASGVLDRAVEDLGVSARAFGSTDIVAVMGLIKSPDGTRFSRRVTEVSEVRQGTDGVELVPLFSTGPGCSCAKPSPFFNSKCKTVAGIADAFGIDPEAVLDLLKARAHSDQLIAEALTGGNWTAAELNDEFRVASNELLNRCLFGRSGAEAGLREWRSWFDARVSR